MGTDSPKGEGNATQPETVLVSNSFQPTGSLTGNVHLPTDIQGTQAWNGGALEQTKAIQLDLVYDWTPGYAYGLGYSQCIAGCCS